MLNYIEKPEISVIVFGIVSHHFIGWLQCLSTKSILWKREFVREYAEKDEVHANDKDVYVSVDINLPFTTGYWSTVIPQHSRVLPPQDTQEC